MPLSLQYRIIMILIEAGAVVPLCLALLLVLLRAVAAWRLRLFSVFLDLPRPAVLALARWEGCGAFGF